MPFPSPGDLPNPGIKPRSPALEADALTSESPGKSPANTGDPGLTLGQEDTLEKGMATYTSVLAWRIPWTEEPSRLQSMGLQRLHD